jgi:CRISPR-associated Csx2 family protein
MSRHVLVCFVGDVPRVTRHRFGTNPPATSAPHPAGRALLAHLRATATESKPAPDRLGLIGTSGSHFEAWYPADKPADARSVYNDIFRKADRNQVREADLADLATRLTDDLGIECVPKVVPYGLKEEDQLKTLDALEGLVEEGVILTLDVTHAMRHLPMIALLAAFQLGVLKRVTVNGLFYGAMNLRKDEGGGGEGVTQMIDLAGLLRLADWIGTLHAFRVDRDYGKLVPLLKYDELPDEHANSLRSASFAQQVQWLDVAEKQVGQVKGWLAAGAPGLGGVSRHFVPLLTEQLAWTDEPSAFAKHKKLAIDAIENKSLWPATLYGFEAFVTRVTVEPDAWLNPASSDAARKQYDKAKAARDPGKRREAYRRAFEEGWNELEERELHEVPDAGKQAYERFRCYRDLQNLRNAVAHGATRKIEKKKMPIETDMTALISDAGRLETVLRESFARLLH